MSKLNTLAVCLLSAALLHAERQFKSQAEYEAYNDVGKDLAANNPQKALTDLDTWKQKFPDSDFKGDREALTVQALAASNQPAKALDAASDLIAKDLTTALSGPAPVIKLLFTLAQAIQKLPDPSPAQLATGSQAAHQLAAFEKTPDGVAPEAWVQARRDMQAASKAALLYTALIPAAQAMNHKDCDAAQTYARKAIDDFPASGQAAWSLGLALFCSQKTHPENAPIAIYEFSRASSLDPQTGMVDPSWQKSVAGPYLERIYAQYHGADAEGLAQLKALSVQSPLPPAGFQLKTITQIADEKQAAFRQANPQLALWMDIKAALTAPNGAQYFESELKNSAVPELTGTLAEAKPACRPKELRIVIQNEPDILLKLEKPLTGQPDVGSEVHFEAVPSSFSAAPFLLTMDADPSKLSNLKTTPCKK